LSVATELSALLQWSELARARYSDVTVDLQQLARHLERLAISGTEHPHAADLVLACACAAGDAAAIAAFDRELMPVAASAARKIDAATAFVDEVVQLTRERLLIAADGNEPRIATYSGDGPLKAWVRVAAMRVAMNELRTRKRDLLVDDEAFFDAMPVGTGEHQRAARQHYVHACSDALRDAFATLTPRERNLLRMHHIHGLTVDELAPTLGVHRATVARWIAAARERLLDETRAGLQAKLNIATDTADSILRELAGRIEISVTRLLAESG
jgi:RNA polymerase sigma-70 factor (ECF subfamily)